MAVRDLYRRHGVNEASYYQWWSTFGGTSVCEAKRLRELEVGNASRKKLLAGSML